MSTKALGSAQSLGAFRIVSALAVSLFAAPVEAGDVNVEWRPTDYEIQADDIVDIGLYVVSADGSNQPISVVEAALTWDSTKLELLELVHNGPYAWLASYFPNDSNQDGLNAPYGGIPSNDGDAWYNALAQFPPQPTALATAAGLRVVTLRFRALGEGQTQVRLEALLGTATMTQIWDGENAGNVITGTLGSPASVTVLRSIPTVSIWGLLVSALLTATAGTVLTRKVSG